MTVTGGGNPRGSSGVEPKSGPTTPSGVSSANSAGEYLYRPPPPRHVCKPPNATFLGWVYGVATGTVWQCDCDQVWVVVFVDAVDHGGVTTVAHCEWQEETRKQRRSRLGLRWWQREAR